MAISYFWRLFVLAACFTAFGAGGVVFRVTLFPFLRLLPGTADERHRRTRRLMHGCFRLVIAILRVTGTMTLEVRNPERLRDVRGALILANHPSYLDVVLLLGLVPEANCVVKQGLWRNRFFGGVVRNTGYVSNADPDRLVDDCAAVLRKGETLLVFPEGTRTVPGRPMHFQRGAARIALRGQCDMIPVILTCEPPVWAKGFRITHIAKQAFCMRLTVESALRLEGLGIEIGEEEARTARQLTRKLEGYFTSQVERYERPASGNQTPDHRILEPGRSDAG